MRKDLIGKKFGRLTIINRYMNPELIGTTRHYRLDCLCDCGCVVKNLGQHNVTRGTTKSCGCLRKENLHLLGRKNRKIPLKSLSELHTDHESCLKVWYAMFGYWPKFLKISYHAGLKDTCMFMDDSEDNLSIQNSGRITRRHDYWL